MDLLLNICIYLPLLGMVLLMVTSSPKAVKWLSLIVTSLTFLLSIPLLLNFDISQAAGIQYMTEGNSIMPGLDVKYLIGLDGLSILLFMLTTLFGPIVILSSWDSVKKNIKGYYAMLLLLETASLGVFASLDIIVFYVFFELSLIPMYFLIGIWGGSNRIVATVKFFVYTMVGSLIMLLGIIYVGYDAGNYIMGYTFTTDWRFLAGPEYQIGLVQQTYLFLAFAFAFSIKIPLFPLHTWLPYAHTEAPTAGSVVLAAILLKMGTYGLIRICLPLFPNAFSAFAPYLATLAVIGIIYGALVAMVQKDVKKLVAYSSVSHLGFVVLGIFALNTISMQGAVIQMVNHGLSTGALFLIVGMIYDRRHTRMIKDFGGIARVIPVFAVMFMIAMLSSIGLPGLNGFIGEFLILMGAFNSEILNNSTFAILGTTGVILAAVYMLWMYQRVMFGPVKHEENKKLKDLNAREIGLLIPLVIFMVWIGIKPVDYMQYTESTVNTLIEESNEKKLAIIERASEESVPIWVAEWYNLDQNITQHSLITKKGE